MNDSLLIRIDAYNTQLFNITEGYLRNTNHVVASLSEFKQSLENIDISPITRSIFDVFERIGKVEKAVISIDERLAVIDSSLLWLAKDIRGFLSKMDLRLSESDNRIAKLAERIGGLTTEVRLNSRDRTPNEDKLVSSCELSTRLKNALRSIYCDYHTMTLGELMRTTPSELIREPNVGRRTVQELQSIMQAHGLELGGGTQ